MSRELGAVVDGAPAILRIGDDARIQGIEAAPTLGLDRAPRVTRGFVDLHAHGAAGHSYDDAAPAGIAAALALHRAHGTTGALLSLVSAPVPALARRLAQLRSELPAHPGALGVHLEGPFLAPGRRGAHDPHALTAPTPAAVDALLEAGEGALRVVTIAPELPGALAAIDRFVAAGVDVAVGHTEADAAGAAAAFDRGASLLTHAYNAMPGLGHRDPGPIGAALERDHVVLELIADGIHVAPVVLAALVAAAPGRVALVTDAMAATGLGDGRHRLGGLDVDVVDGRPVLAGSTTLAGSTLTLDRAIAIAVGAGVDVDAAVAAATAVPAAVLGLGTRPIAAGTALADLVAIGPDGSRLDLRS
ncbi:amidohydrolase family protein [Agrococcus terreus]|uniref:N-acetylglucosamine-6-phosphate deacetylase n=1 Tax=Agrococcus terreus TaxID=574649 RepID=UPI00384E6D66